MLSLLKSLLGMKYCLKLFLVRTPRLKFRRVLPYDTDVWLGYIANG